MTAAVTAEPTRTQPEGSAAAMFLGAGHGCITVRSHHRSAAAGTRTDGQTRIHRIPEHTEQATSATVLARPASGPSALHHSAVKGSGAHAVSITSRRIAERLGSHCPGWAPGREEQLLDPVCADQDPVLLIEEAIKHLVHVDGLDLEAEAHVTAENRLLLPTHGPAAREELRTGAVIIDVVKAGTRVAEADMAWTGTTSPDLAALVHRIEQALQRAQAPHQTAPTRIQMLLLDGTAGVFLHEVCGHLLESTWQRPSLVIDRIGDQIAHEQLHVDDEPLHAESFGAHRHTALGAKARRRSLIDAGNLVGLLADTPDGPWRAQDARHVPKPRMSNLTAAPACSDMPLDAALGSATTPVVRVHRLGTGSLDHRDGTILLEVKEATYQQGACTYRLAPFLVTAEARHLLMDIRAIGDAATLSTWSAYCLGASGSLPVSATVPVLLTGPVTTLPHRPLSPPRPAVIRH